MTDHTPDDVHDDCPVLRPASHGVILRRLDGQTLDPTEAETYPEPFHAQHLASPLVALVEPEGASWLVIAPGTPTLRPRLIGHVELVHGEFYLMDTRRLDSIPYTPRPALAQALERLLLPDAASSSE